MLMQNINQLNFIFMIIIKAGLEVINGVKHFCKVIQYSNGVITKRVFNDKGEHIDSIPIVKLNSRRIAAVEVDIRESKDFDMDRFTKLSRGH